MEDLHDCVVFFAERNDVGIGAIGRPRRQHPFDFPGAGLDSFLQARRKEVPGLVLLDGLRPALLGPALGLVGSIVASQLIRSMLYGIHPLDPSVFFAVIAILLSVACVAGLIPAWRASRLDPMTALRTE